METNEIITELVKISLMINEPADLPAKLTLNKLISKIEILDVQQWDILIWKKCLLWAIWDLKIWSVIWSLKTGGKSTLKIHPQKTTRNKRVVLGYSYSFSLNNILHITYYICSRGYNLRYSKGYSTKLCGWILSFFCYYFLVFFNKFK